MHEIVKSISERGGGLVILLVVIILSLSGLYRLHTDDVTNLKKMIEDSNEKADSRVEWYYKTESRVTILESKID